MRFTLLVLANFLATELTGSDVVLDRACSNGDIITQANGNDRLNWYPESGINKSKSLEIIWSVVLKNNEQFYAMPLVYCGLVVLAGMENNIYLINAKSGVLERKISLGIPYDIAIETPGCTMNIDPFVGILSTPAIDPETDTIFLAYSTYLPGTSSGIDNCEYKFNALNIFSLTPRSNFPITIEGTKHGKTFKAGWQMNRPALLLVEGKIYIAFASHCDFYEYHGWVFKVDAVSGRIDDILVTTGDAVRVFGAGIWQSGVGPSSDGMGSIFVTTGNSIPDSDDFFAKPLPGNQPPVALGNTVMQINTSTMKVDDFFAPGHLQLLSKIDIDLGASGVSLLPPEFGTVKHPSLALLTGKDGFVYVLDRADLGGYQQGFNHTDNVVFESGEFGDVHDPHKIRLYCSPSVWPGDQMIFLTTEGGPMYGLSRKFDNYTGAFSFDVIGRTPPDIKLSFGIPTAVFSLGKESGSASIWLADRELKSLLVFDSVPDQEGQLALLAQFNIGMSAKFLNPVAVNGLAYVVTLDGKLFAIGNK